jgi:two-component system sensor histidine kinase SenX3
VDNSSYETCPNRARPLADRKRISLTLDEVRVAGDRELMEYACYNLLTNAVKYSPQPTEVRISSWRDNGHIRLAVKDQGIGMDPKEVTRIFQKFYRTKRAEESAEAGTGISLAIVEQFVEQQGGMIEVVSQPGAGSCFTLVLSRRCGARLHFSRSRPFGRLRGPRTLAPCSSTKSAMSV